METNNITLSETFQDAPGLVQQVETRRNVVAEAIDLQTATAIWDRVRDHWGRDVLVLKVRDRLGAQSQGQFAPAELANESHLRGRLHDLLGAALRISGWRSRLREFLDTVRNWVQDRDPAALFEEGQIVLNEERSGPYEVPLLRISSGGRSAQLTPVACWVVGADGRVDLRGPGGNEVFLLEGQRWLWLSGQPLSRTNPVNPDLFLQVLRAVLQ